LVRDPDVAEEVRQDASIAVLRGPKPVPGAHRAWLATVVLNSLRLRLRKSARLARADSAAASGGLLEEAASPESLVEHAQTRRIVAHAVFKLEEPFRSTILLRFYEGLTSVEIAQMKNVPAGTVRWRLKVGLDRLRASLDTRDGGDRKRWGLLVAPFGIKIPNRGRSAVGWALRLPFLAAVATLVPLSVLLLGQVRARPPEFARPRPSVASEAPPPRFALLPEVTGARWSDDDRTRPAAPTAGTSELRGRIVDVEGNPIPHARIVAKVADASDRHAFEAQADEKGSYHVLLPATDYVVQAAAAGYVRDHRHLRFSGDATVDFQLGPAARLRGLVIEQATDLPVPGATVGLQGRQNRFRVWTGADGVFVFDDLPTDTYQLYAYGPGEVGTLSHPLALVGGQRTEGVLVALDERLVVSGRVRDQEGRPIRGAELRLTGENLPEVLRTVSGVDGEYRLAGLLAGRYQLSAAAHQRATHQQVVTLRSTNVAADVVLLAEAVLVGRVTDRSGMPAPAAQVRIDWDGAGGRRVAFATADAGGRFTLQGLAPGQARIGARLDGVESRMRPLALTEGSQEITVALPRGIVVSGTIRWQDGAPAAGALVTARSGGGRLAIVRTDADGAYLLGPLSEGPAVLRAYEPATAPLAELRRRLRALSAPTKSDAETRLLDVANADLAGIDLVLPRGTLPLAGVVLGADGTPLEGANVTARPLESTAWQSRLGAQPRVFHVLTGPRGIFRMRDLPAGPLSLTVRYPQLEPFQASGVRAGDVAITLRFPPTGVPAESEGPLEKP
jgi:RNA polymerase sigma factor (sigma-70 family)